ncbi:MAG: type II toxin-antitoxin system VapC family toxin [Brachymonas sp.]|nr:type II toxin-antitoxin system VapC family toxin [Brachymonas sp.]
MTRYMLDTNIVSHLLKEHPAVIARVQSVPMASLCISAITEAELHFGLAKRPTNKPLHRAVHELLIRVESIAWSSAAAQAYGAARFKCNAKRQDTRAARFTHCSHAISLGAMLVTNDQAMHQLTGLQVQDWTQMPPAQ